MAANQLALARIANAEARRKRKEDAQQLAVIEKRFQATKAVITSATQPSRTFVLHTVALNFTMILKQLRLHLQWAKCQISPLAYYT